MASIVNKFPTLDKVLSLDYTVAMKEIITYKTIDGRCPIDMWMDGLDKSIKARIDKRLERVVDGNYGDFKRINANVLELRFNFGAGYRVYFSEIGDVIVLLLCGGDKSSQVQDIKKANVYFSDLAERFGNEI